MRLIDKEEPFSVVTGAVAIGQTSAGYTLQFSVDNVNWTNMKDVPANEDVLIPMINLGTFMRLKNNVDEAVKVQN